MVRCVRVYAKPGSRPGDPQELPCLGRDITASSEGVVPLFFAVGRFSGPISRANPAVLLAVAALLALTLVACSTVSEDSPAQDVDTPDDIDTLSDSLENGDDTAPMDTTDDESGREVDSETATDDAEVGVEPNDTVEADVEAVDVPPTDGSAVDGGELPFACADGRTLPALQRCDNQPDCTNAEDEWNCSWFQCSDGTRLAVDPRTGAVSGFCEGSPDYFGFNCDPSTPGSNALRWDDLPTFRCNGVPDCIVAVAPDGQGGFTSRDEADCVSPAFSCMVAENQVFYSAADMVPVEQVCDGTCDCNSPGVTLARGLCRDEFVPDCTTHFACDDFVALPRATACENVTACRAIVCNGPIDCFGAPDERTCDGDDTVLCPWPVGSGRYISRTRLCDDWVDCPDQWDEGVDNCFACEALDGGLVVPLAARCDGTPDCVDESDEEACL